MRKNRAGDSGFESRACKLCVEGWGWGCSVGVGVSVWVGVRLGVRHPCYSNRAVPITRRTRYADACMHSITAPHVHGVLLLSPLLPILSFAGTAPPILDRSQISAGDQKHDIEAFVRGPLCTALSRFFVLGFKSNSLFKVHPRCHICTGTELAPATSAPGLGSPVPTSAPGLGSSEWHALPRG